LSKKQKKKIERLHGEIHVYDTSPFSNETFYRSHRNIIFKNEEHDFIDEQKYYGIASGKPVQNCEFSSCLGKNLYISHDGVASFCPHRITETKMCNIYKTDNVFSNEVFINVLKESIAQRYACANCLFRQKCNGYCALENCSVFKNKFETAYADIQNIIMQKEKLSTIPLYKEQAVLYALLYSGIQKYPDLSRKEERYD
jgi:radical SAM protein with 4Fe4S-binding SPASM domain